ncbi:outer membrane beta-barrel family protein [Capnocytophaga canimorsus]|uniref:outer membrane beta-barrel family protein n=1 Tax=Capnocytophaga canimorsus TaxID=28188 RepID=UPI000F6E099D|nr:outer membrane beta-barrel family protein [Capnocytophaga canimorsus]VEJ19850.1 TonB-dependent receptor [Capnocytophaga canimorsus]
MKKLLLILYFLSAFSYGQDFSISGKVVDSQTKEEMPFTEVALQGISNKSVEIGVVSDEKGHFRIKNLQKGKYSITFHFVGYEKFTKEINIEQHKTDLGVIPMKIASENLSEVVVEGKRAALSYSVDRKTINADAFPEASNAIDLLTNVPSIQISVEGKISYREGGSFKVYINGIAVKNGEERLRTLEASQIEKIEIITNPSARYSSEGTAGIIRVLLKKNRLEGYAINASVLANTLATNQISFSTDKKGKRGGWHTSAYLGHSTNAKTDMETFNQLQSDTKFFEIHEIRHSKKRNRSNFFEFGFNYDVTDNDFIDFSVNLKPLRDREREISYVQTTENIFNLNRNLIASEKSTNNNSYAFDYQMVGVNLEYNHFFNKDKSHSLKLTSGYDVFIGSSDSEYRNVWTRPSETIVFGSVESEKNEIFTSTELAYELPLTEKSNLEAGIAIETDFIPEITTESGIFHGDKIGIPSSDFPSNQKIKYEQNEYSAYATFKSSWKKFEYKLGLRVEHTRRDVSYSYTTNSAVQTTDVYKKNFTDWFPSVHLLYSFSDDTQLAANYSRRIHRPEYWAITPVFKMEDRYTYTNGNSRLQFSYTDAYEVNFKKSWGKDFLSVEVFARNQHDFFGNYRRPFRDNILLITQENLGDSWSVGSELMTGVDIFSWWNVNASVSGFYFEQKTNVDGVKNDFSQWRFHGKMNNTFKFPKNFSARLNCAFQSPITNLQFESNAIFLASASLTKSFKDNRWQLTLSGWNVFDSYRQTQQRNSEKFALKDQTRYQPYVSFSVKYQFNNQK